MKKIASLITLILFGYFVKSQELAGTWSDKENYSKSSGFYADFVGGNSKFVYSRSRGGGGKTYLVSHDKTNMKESGSVALFNVKEAKDPKKYKGLRYHKTIVFENTIYVFWIIDSKTKDELFVESYDSKLKKLNALKKVYELSSSKSDLRKAELFIMGNQKAGEKIIIGGELSANEGQNIKMEFKVLNADFTFAAANQVTLPVIAKKGKLRNLFASRGSDALSSDYEYGDDGNLHLKTYVTVSDEEKKDLKKGESKSYAIYSLVNVSAGKIYSYSMKADNKNILNFDFKVTKNVIKVFGFFNDVIKGGTLNGIFTASVDPKTYTISNLNFTYFTEAQLNTLFAKDKEDANKSSIFASKKKKKDDKESLSSNYVIEDVQAIDKDNLVLFCDKMINWSVTTCDSKGNCTTRYYCDKHNVTVFKINTKGDIVWASNLDRVKIKYPGWYVYDIKVINSGNKFFVSYGSDYNVLEGQGRNGKNKKQKKSKDQKNDRFEYAIVDYTNGNIQRKEYEVNAMNAKKEDIKKIDVLKLKPIDNQFYINYSKKNFGYLFTRKKTGYMGKIATK